MGSYPYHHEWYPAGNCKLVQSHADAGFGFSPSEFPIQYVNDFKAWMHGPSAHEERVADLKVRRDNATRAHESTINNVKNGMYELQHLRKPLEDMYKKQCAELPLMAEEVQKSVHDLKALEKQLQATQAENDAYHAKTSANSHASTNMTSDAHHNQNTYY